jgi:hypothetical protein
MMRIKARHISKYEIEIRKCVEEEFYLPLKLAHVSPDKNCMILAMKIDR